jgi:hypothetical protein
VRGKDTEASGSRRRIGLNGRLNFSRARSPERCLVTNLDWRTMMKHEAQAILAFGISAALCLVVWVWARYRVAHLSRER